MIPSVLAKQLQKGAGEYVDATFPMSNAPFSGSLKSYVETEGAMCREPYFAVRLPFRRAEGMPGCFQAVECEHIPYVHQMRAFERLCSDTPRSTLIATGTGSGKTECFLYPILEHCFRQRQRKEEGIKAIVIYPMNALASDQARRIAKLIHGNGKLRGHVTVGMYVGSGGKERKEETRAMGESHVITDHATLLENPPDILLTNYKMLDYLLLRPRDSRLWGKNGPKTLKFVAVDELHTFDGAQGTDLACLLRRLKSRLKTPEGHLCCIGTSATMGDGESAQGILSYASQIFGEPFDPSAVITEDRLSAEEFLSNAEPEYSHVPDEGQTDGLDRLAEEDDAEGYLREAVRAWFPGFEGDPLSDEGRLRLPSLLLRHSFFRDLVRLTQGGYFQPSRAAESLRRSYGGLTPRSGESAVCSMYAIISHARCGKKGSLTPFLQVQGQLWMRELTRFLAKVSDERTEYAVASDIAAGEEKGYLPVVSCHDCGATGWAAYLSATDSARILDLGAFYNRFFRPDRDVTFLYPGMEGRADGLDEAAICPACLQVCAKSFAACPECGEKTVRVWIRRGPKLRGSGKGASYCCPCCGSAGGLSLVGRRSASLISVCISQLFASRFNDDKKTLAFSDSVQDAAHRAGFFGARTWRFTVRGAMQHYCLDGGAGRSLDEFQRGFPAYLRGKVPSDEDFVGTYIAPDMTWRKAYAEMTERGRLDDSSASKDLIASVGKRLRYEVLLEYGVASRAGKTLERTASSALVFKEGDIRQIAARVQKRAEGLGIAEDLSADGFCRMVLGYLHLIRQSGAFEDPVYAKFVQSGNGYFLSPGPRGGGNWWMPSQNFGRNVPSFMVSGGGGKDSPFDSPTGAKSKYTGWVAAFRKGDMRREAGAEDELSRMILEESVRQGVLSLNAPALAAGAAPGGRKVYALKKDRVFVTGRVRHLRCGACGIVHAYGEGEADIMEGAPCLRRGCRGTLGFGPGGESRYYGRLYGNGDLVRINAQEHTGILGREEREKLEGEFKSRADASRPWYPNVLSCTPTMEMGIDIGDLSAVILCDMPPAQSQYLQRTGRAGRTDGNALTLAVCRARPHDLYFYQDPAEMIGGSVQPPHIFLNASAVLERQLIAYCMDCWIREDRAAGNAIPKNVGLALKSLYGDGDPSFPGAFLSFVRENAPRLSEGFLGLFRGGLDESSVRELEAFVRSGDEGVPMERKIMGAFSALKTQTDSLRERIRAVKESVKALREGRPQDSGYDRDIRELEEDWKALSKVLDDIEGKDLYNFLSDEGILPNYAFPEAGTVLRAVIWRKSEEVPLDQGKREERPSEFRTVYEYVRPASAAISELAPDNNFYAGGRKLRIDQVDLSAAKPARWRLCPKCAHMEPETPDGPKACCPRCGSPGWGDTGQVRTMLRAQTVYSNMEESESRSYDASDERANVFYNRRMLVDVDGVKDVEAAFRMRGKDFAFGYEFVRKATLREINFGESDESGEAMEVAGEASVRKGFTICRHCGKVLPKNPGPGDHALSCRTRRPGYGVRSLLSPQGGEGEQAEECIFLYREFTTEILRILIPSDLFSAYDGRRDSFIAAFMLGLKKYFGNVDHLQFTLSQSPEDGQGEQKQYLVVYDSVPGGTGYLKQLMRGGGETMREVFQMSLDAMENCECRNDPQKDGCYRCLFAYRQSGRMGNISRTAAMELVRSVLSAKECEQIGTVEDIDMGGVFESGLERMFIGAVRKKAGPGNVCDIVTQSGRHGYRVTAGGCVWEAEPQAELGPRDGVAVCCRPDFLFRCTSPKPQGGRGRRAVAVFTDGFEYHKDIAADDSLKREAIRRSDRFVVWSLSYKDVLDVFSPRGEYFTDALDPARLPGGALYEKTVQRLRAEELRVSGSAPFDRFMDFLRLPEAESLFGAHARAFSLAMTDPKSVSDERLFGEWKEETETLMRKAGRAGGDFLFGKTLFGAWDAGENLRVTAGYQKGAKGADVTVCLKDGANVRSGMYKSDWNGFWQLWDVMQFAPGFFAVTEEGLDKGIYRSLPGPGTEKEEKKAPGSPGGDAWERLIGEMALEGEAREFARQAGLAGVPAPDEEDVGYELDDGTPLELAWPDRKICYMAEGQAKEARGAAESRGWRVLTGADAPRLREIFGGE